MIKKAIKMSLTLVIATFMFVQISSAKTVEYEVTIKTKRGKVVSYVNRVKVGTIVIVKNRRNMDTKGKLTSIKGEIVSVKIGQKNQIGKTEIEGNSYVLLYRDRKFYIKGPELKKSRKY